ncbi:MAG TPA: nicotinate phosphoribosyltransferase [Thermoanaerobaculia bacterium]|nr:nicotinate phosphoribosyltransferase [Thermoanaerobaculia bacterium]
MPERRAYARPPEPSPLLTDFYELTMAQAYHRESLHRPAVFSLYFRALPPARNYVLACGLGDALSYLETLRFGGADLDALAGTGGFDDGFLRWLEGFRFAGDVRAMPEGTPVFPDEPLLEIEASLPEAQLVETLVMNHVHLQSVLGSKAARVVHAAGGRPVVDFGMRRMHGIDAAWRSVRAFWIAGVAATSNVAAGLHYGVPITGTMAHSYVQAHDDELEAFRELTALYPETALLVDTYDTLAGVRRVVELARQLGPAFRVRAIRLDSGDLAELAKRSREILDAAGLERVEIFASGGLDELEIAALLADGAPVDGFGVGTRMGTSSDAPTLDLAYKLVAYAGRGRLKLSPGKRILPGPKQVFRREVGGVAEQDVVACAGERLPGRPLLVRVMQGGVRTDSGQASLEEARARARDEIGRLPDRLRRLERAEPAYPVAISGALRSLADETADRALEAAE